MFIVMAEANAKFKRWIAKGQGCPGAHARHRRKTRPTRAIALAVWYGRTKSCRPRPARGLRPRSFYPGDHRRIRFTRRFGCDLV